MVNRNENLAIGNALTGRLIGRAARAIKLLLLDEHRLLVAVDANGEVYALSPDSERAHAVEAKHPDWIVGWYNRRSEAKRIAGDLLAQALSALGLAA